MPDRGQQYRRFHQRGLETRSIAEVGRDRFGERLGALAHHFIETLETLDADARVWRAFTRMRGALQLKEPFRVRYVLG